jgi:HK97 gp10 family phage protein
MISLRHDFNKLVEDMEAVRRKVRSATRAATQEANKPIAQAYENGLRAHDTDGPAVRKRNGVYEPRPHISQTVGSKVWRYPDGNGYAGIVGTKSGQAPHAHLLEHGTKFRYRKKIGGKYAYVEVMIQKGLRDPEVRWTKEAKPHNVLANAFRSSQGAATQAFKNKYAAKLKD